MKIFLICLTSFSVIRSYGQGDIIIYPVFPLHITYPKPMALIIQNCDEYNGPNPNYYYVGEETNYILPDD